MTGMHSGMPIAKVVEFSWCFVRNVAAGLEYFPMLRRALVSGLHACPCVEVKPFIIRFCTPSDLLRSMTNVFGTIERELERLISSSSAAEDSVRAVDVLSPISAQ